ncbi:MAG: hypothetical protein P1U34_05135 [Coxiellaceae bacterium]|nr:hypothetical protein [Coxiellaceae bacterium]
MSNTDKDYLSQITADDEEVVEVSDDVDEKKSPDKAKARLETRRRLEDMLEAKRLYAELDDYA